MTTRRRFLAGAAAMGITAAWANPQSKRSSFVALQRREHYPQGVASADPDSHSVILWTRRPFTSTSESSLLVEVSLNDDFTRVVASTRVKVLAESDWTCRVLVGRLRPSRIYWYRFIDLEGSSSRIGRTMTAPSESDARPVKFAFVSCQNTNTGAQHAYKRMIFEDENASEAERLGFVLHLGDFYYEALYYPEDRAAGLFGRRLRDILRYPRGEKIDDVHVPVTLEDYRSIFRAYLNDPDLQNARARWPFVSIWDNGEFSWEGWQSMLAVRDRIQPAQTRKIAANQAWFEYQPARIKKASGPNNDKFGPQPVHDAPIEKYDDDGLGQEPNNLAAISSLTGYRALRWGRNVELIITDQRSYCSRPPTAHPEAKALRSDDFPRMVPEEALKIVDAGRAFGGGIPPATIRIGDEEIPNFRMNSPPQTVLGAEQKRWFLQQLKTSSATWKIWGNTIGTLDGRADPQNLPAGITTPWHGQGYAVAQLGDFATAYFERAEIYAAARDSKVTGFVTISGNSHSFWAGFAAASLPPEPFEPVGLAFVTGAISAINVIEYLEHSLRPDHPLHSIYLAKRSADERAEATFNMLVRHGVRSCLEYQRTGDIELARALSNKELAPHLTFLDWDGHGFSTVRASSEELACEFVAIPRPLERPSRDDGGPVRYRVVHRAKLWAAGERPQLKQDIVEGNPYMSI